MTEYVKVYGFGSFFGSRKDSARDVDLLIVHENSRKSSIEFVLQCKALMESKIPNSHIVMLSIREEYQLDFLNKSRAQFLVEINTTNVHQCIGTIIDRIARMATSSVDEAPPGRHTPTCSSATKTANSRTRMPTT